MLIRKGLIILVVIVAGFTEIPAQASAFISVNNRTFQLNQRHYYFIGTNYWYGSLLGLEEDKKRGAGRLRKELDFLKANGVTNLRLMAGAEGSGIINGVERVGPALQVQLGKFDEHALDGLDLVLAEMAKRDMKAVIFFSNNWEWSGGFLQYLIWNELVPPEMRAEKLTWDQLRDMGARFYVCYECKAGYIKQMRFVLDRTNKISGVKYTDDPTIMAWEIANEPRPMRPGANERYVEFIRDAAAEIKSRDKNHLVTIGHEGSIGTESMELFERVHPIRTSII
jgi:mannan endo-1,4-beta-mannosidase